MKNTAVSERSILKFRSEGEPTRAPDRVAVEEPLEIRVHGDPLAVTMRTPGEDRQLSAGFLFSEGIVHSADDLSSIVHCGRPDEEGFGNTVDVTAAPGVHFDVERVRTAKRGTLTTSACGVCGRQSVDDLAKVAGKLEDRRKISRSLILDAPERLRAAQENFARTGGTHAAAAFSDEGVILAAFEDVGRHNAVDKVVGELVLRRALDRGPGPLVRAPLSPRAGTPPLLLAVSGRASFEILQKAAVAKIPVVAAVGAPSSLAVDLASRLGLTLCAFVRQGTFNVYTGEERLT